MWYCGDCFFGGSVTQSVLEAISKIESGAGMINLAVKELTSEDIGPLCKVLKKNRTVEALYLQLNRLGPEAGRLIADVLMVNRSLKILHLFNNELGPRGGRCIIDALQVNETLEELLLTSNGCRGLGEPIGEALSCNKTLRYLDVDLNDLGADQVKFITDTLATNNTSLETLRLSGNELGDQGATHVAQMLKVNTGLKELYITNNSIGNEGGQLIADALNGNVTLKKLDLTSNRIDSNIMIMVESKLATRNV